MIAALLLALAPNIHPFDSGVTDGTPYIYTGDQHFNPAPHTALPVDPPPVGTAKVEVHVQYETEIAYYFQNPWGIPLDSFVMSVGVQHWFSNPEGESYPYLGGIGSSSSYTLLNVPADGTWTSGPLTSVSQQVFTFGTTNDCTPAVPLDQFALDPTLYYASTFVAAPSMATVGGRTVIFNYQNGSHYLFAYLTARAHGYVIYRDVNGNEL